MNLVQCRRSALVLIDSPNLVQAMYSVIKALRSSTVAQRRVTAVNVREHGKDKFSKMLRFMHAVSPLIEKELDK